MYRRAGSLPAPRISPAPWPGFRGVSLAGWRGPLHAVPRPALRAGGPGGAVGSPRHAGDLRVVCADPHTMSALRN